MTATDAPTDPKTERAATASRGTSAPDDRRWWTLGAVCLGTFMLLLDVTIVNVALPAIQTSLRSTFSDLQWVIDAYALTLAALLLTAGSLADLFGRRRLFIIGLAIFTAASVLCGVAANTLMLQLSRGLQGVGGAIMFAVSLALLANAFRGKDRGTAFGIWGAVTGVAVALGPVLGGALTTGLSWRWIFLVNLPVGIVAIVLTVLRVSESKDDRAGRPDLVGFVVLSGALASLVYALIEAGRRSFTDGLVLACFALAVVLLATFVAVESRSSHPMLELALFRKPTFSGGAIAAFGVSAGIFAMLLYLTLYLQDVLRYSALQTGLRLLVLSAAILVVSTVAGRVSSHVPVRLLVGPGLLLVGVGLLLMRGLDAGSSWTHLVPGLIVAGVGVGLINPPLASTAVGVVPPRQAGMASGVNSTFRQVGIATGIALLGTLFASRLQSSLVHALAGTPLAPRAGELATAVQGGGLERVLGSVPAASRGQLLHAGTAAFTSGLDHILLVAAIGTLAAGLGALALIRSKDFHAYGAAQPAGHAG